MPNPRSLSPPVFSPRGLSPFWPLAIFFVFSSFAFGCMESWSIATCEVILFLGAAIVGWRDPDFWRWPKYLKWPALLVVVLLVIGALQLIPLPTSFWRTLGPDRIERYEQGAQAEALLHTPGYRNDPFDPSPAAEEETWKQLTPIPPTWLPASFTPMETLKALIALAAGLCLVLLLSRLADRSESLLNLELLAGYLGLAVALLALVQHQSTTGTILWTRTSAHAGSAFGPFINPNHGAAFVNLTLPFLYHLLWRRFTKTKLISEKVGALLVTAGLMALHVAVIAVNSSRGALLALSLYPLAWLAYGAARKAKWLWAGAGLYAGTLVAGFGLSWYWGLLSDHGRHDLNANIPLSQWLLGNGLGSFNVRFPAVWTHLSALEPVRNTHLENEYLQAFFEAGAVPALIGFAWAAVILVLAWKVCAAGSAAFWLVPALIGETARAAVDFSAHAFPLVAAYLLVVAVTLQANDRKRGRLSRSGNCIADTSFQSQNPSGAS